MLVKFAEWMRACMYTGRERRQNLLRPLCKGEMEKVSWTCP